MRPVQTTVRGRESKSTKLTEGKEKETGRDHEQSKRSPSAERG